MRWARLLAAFVVLLGGTAIGGPVAATTAQQPPAIDPSLDKLANCVTTNKRLALVVLVDESGSLEKTDPGASRVPAAKAAVAGLVGLVDRSGGQVAVDVQVAGFGVDFEAGAPWQRVDGAGRGACPAECHRRRGCHPDGARRAGE